MKGYLITRANPGVRGPIVIEILYLPEHFSFKTRKEGNKRSYSLDDGVTGLEQLNSARGEWPYGVSFDVDEVDIEPSMKDSLARFVQKYQEVERELELVQNRRRELSDESRNLIELVRK